MRAITLLAITASMASAATVTTPYAIRIDQRNAAGSNMVTSYADTYGVPGLYLYTGNPGADALEIVSLGTGLSWTPRDPVTNTPGVLSVSTPGQVKADWNATTGVAEILNKPTLFSGDYTDLSNKPTLFSGAYADLTGKPTLFSGDYTDLSNIPTFATVATSGDYDDLSDKPTLFSGNYADLSGKPTLFSGNYSDLTGKPTLFSGAYSDLTGSPSLATVATTGAYSDLSGKPTLATVATTGAYSDLSGRPSLATVATSGDYADLTNKPSIPTNTNQLTNGAGFITGIDSAAVVTALGFTPYNATNPSSYITQSGARSAISLTTTGSGAATYNNSTGVLNVPTPAVKRMETYSGTSNASGQYSVTFGTAFSTTPNIQANLINGADNQNLRITSISTTGFTVLARNRVDVIGLLPSWTNVSGIGIHVLITEQ